MFIPTALPDGPPDKLHAHRDWGGYCTAFQQVGTSGHLPTARLRVHLPRSPYSTDAVGWLHLHTASRLIIQPVRCQARFLRLLWLRGVTSAELGLWAGRSRHCLLSNNVPCSVSGTDRQAAGRQVPAAALDRAHSSPAQGSLPQKILMVVCWLILFFDYLTVLNSL